MRDWDHHHRKAMKSNSSYHWNMYKKLRNFVNKEVKSSKSRYYHELIEQSKGDSSKIWKAVNDVSSRSNKSSRPQCIVTNGVQHTYSKSIATTLNTYFASVGKSLSAKFASISPNISLKGNDTPETQFQLREIKESFVLKQLLALKTNKAIGLDKISVRLLKCASHSIYHPVTKLLNLSITTCCFPKVWKCSKVRVGTKRGPPFMDPLLDPLNTQYLFSTNSTYA